MRGVGWNPLGRRSRSGPTDGTSPRGRTGYPVVPIDWLVPNALFEDRACATEDPMPQRAARHLARELLAETEAFLSGRYAEQLEDRALPVPVWAWTNRLAHGNDDDLAGTATERRGRSPSGRWRSARAFLAREVLGAVGPDRSLVDIQREVLAPLELELARGRDVGSWTPQLWVAKVRCSLSEYQYARGGAAAARRPRGNSGPSSL
jgi:hypothetical protein